MQVTAKVKTDKIEQSIVEDADKLAKRSSPRVVPAMPKLSELLDMGTTEIFDEVESLKEASEFPTLESNGSFELDDEIGELGELPTKLSEVECDEKAIEVSPPKGLTKFKS